MGLGDLGGGGMWCVPHQKSEVPGVFGILFVGREKSGSVNEGTVEP